MNAIGLTAKIAAELLGCDKSRLLCLDTETTGTDVFRDEVLSLSIVNGLGEIVFEHFVKPKRKSQWPEAQRIHGIGPQDTIHEKFMAEYLPDLVSLADTCDLLVGYNLGFDIMLLENSECPFFSGLPSFDVMAGFSYLHASRSQYRAGFRYKLSSCAKYYNIYYSPHSSSEDACATMACFFAILKELAD
jgi:DNA polymerase III epsilon subunit-like protein